MEGLKLKKEQLKTQIAANTVKLREARRRMQNQNAHGQDEFGSD